jgi:hypothetical protein
MLLHFSGEKALKTAGTDLCRTMRLGLLPILIFHVTLPGTLSSVVLAAKVCSDNIYYTDFSVMIPIIRILVNTFQPSMAWYYGSEGRRRFNYPAG